MFRDKAGNLSVVRIVLAVVVVLAVVALASSSFTVIPAGHTGVVLTFGRVNDVVLQEGLHFKLPFAQQVVTIDNRIVKLEVSTEAFSQDLQTVSTVLAVNYRVSKDQSQNIYKEVGPSFEDVLITPVVNEVLKAVTAEYTAVDLIGSRGEVSVLLNEGLNSKLNEYGIYVNEINIINWDFSEEYIAAVEAKQVAEPRTSSRPAPSRSRRSSSPTPRRRSASSPRRRRPARSRCWPRPTPRATAS